MNLLEIWRNPKSMKMARQQVCARLPIRVQARVDALAAMYERSRSEIIQDLLVSAIERVEADLLRKRPMMPDEVDAFCEFTGFPLEEGDPLPQTYCDDSAINYLRLVEQNEASLLEELEGRPADQDKQGEGVV